MATTQFKRRIGMRRENLGYSLHQDLQRTPPQKVDYPPTRVPKTSSEMTEEELNASPEKSSSDLEQVAHSESEDEFDDRPKKKARISQGTRDEMRGSRELASSSLPAPPSNIRHGTFLRRDRTSLNEIGQSAKKANRGEDPDLKLMQRQQKESQGRQRTYHKNIHAGPSGKENRTPKYKPPPVSEKSTYVDNVTRSSSKESFKRPLVPRNSPRKTRSSKTTFKAPKQASISPTKNPKSSSEIFKRPTTTEHPSSFTTEPEPIFQQPRSLPDASEFDISDLHDSSFSQTSQSECFDISPTQHSSPLSSHFSPEKPDTKGIPMPKVRYFTPQKHCPVCSLPVSLLLLKEHLPSSLPRPTLKQQARFCKIHRQHSALETWSQRNYPPISRLWSNFDTRLRTHHPSIDAILHNRKSSTYRDTFAQHIASGTNRTLRQRLSRNVLIEGLSSGYYGPKGTKLITQNILAAFSGTLRELAAKDKLIAEGEGVAGYVQAVLAPEMAVMLIGEDMHVGEEEARKILRESEEVGGLVHEEEEDEVFVRGTQEV